MSASNSFIFYHVSRTELDNKEVKTAGWGDRFQFGFHDVEEKKGGTFDNPTTYSSCMTTIESPINSRFQYCDTKDVYKIH